MHVFALALLMFVAPAHTDGLEIVANPEADRLAAEAYRLFENRSAWPRAARLLEQSADLREVADPRRSGTYLDAGRVYSHVRAHQDARRAFEAAGRAATDRGAIAQAAHAWLDAAIAAAKTGDRSGAETLLTRGTLLAASPHLAADEREGILRRVGDRALARR